MKKKSLVLLLALSMIFTFVLGACGGGSDESSSDSDTLKVVTEPVPTKFVFFLVGAGHPDGPFFL